MVTFEDNENYQHTHNDPKGLKNLVSISFCVRELLRKVSTPPPQVSWSSTSLAINSSVIYPYDSKFGGEIQYVLLWIMKRFRTNCSYFDVDDV